MELESPAQLKEQFVSGSFAELALIESAHQHSRVYSSPARGLFIELQVERQLWTVIESLAVCVREVSLASYY